MSTPGKAQEVKGSCFPQMPAMKKLFSSKTIANTTSSRLRLEDKVAVITGAASGIGAATARLFVSHGAKVIIADVNATAGRQLSSELGSSAHFFPCDVTNEDSVAGAVDYAVSSWGHLDIMFNNAGVAGPLVGLADVVMDDFDEVMAVHIKGAVLGVKHAARVMIPAGKGVILFSGSTSAVMGGAGPPLYSAANAAVLCIVRSAAAELVRHGIRVNALSPHCVATPMSIATFEKSINSKTNITIEQFQKVLAGTSELDLLTTDKVAHAVMFLASDEAGFISGHNLVLDGGFSVTKRFDSSNLKAALQKSLAAERKAEGRSPTRSLEGSGSSKLGSKVSIARERELEDKAREEGEKAREEEDKAARKAVKKALAEKEMEKKEREKRDKERKMEEDKARAKQDGKPEKRRAEEEKARAKELKALAKERQVPSKDPKATAFKDNSHLNGEIHPLDKKALAKEERIRNENIELPNAGPEPDVPLEFQPKPPVKKINSLLSWGRNLSKNDSGQISKKDSKSPDPEKDFKREKSENKPATDPGKDKKKKKDVKFSEPEDLDSNNEKKEGNLTDTGKVSGKEKEDKPADTVGKVEKKEKEAPKAPSEGPKDSPLTAASGPEITSDPQPKPSPLSRIGSLLRSDRTKEKDHVATDPSKVLPKEKKEYKPADTGQASKKDTNAAKPEIERKGSQKTAASPEITSESQPKPSPLSRIGSLLRTERTKKKDHVSTDLGKASENKVKSKERK